MSFLNNLNRDGFLIDCDSTEDFDCGGRWYLLCQICGNDLNDAAVYFPGSNKYIDCTLSGSLFTNDFESVAKLIDAYWDDTSPGRQVKISTAFDKFVNTLNYMSNDSDSLENDSDDE